MIAETFTSSPSPFDSKDAKPAFEAKITHTPFTVKSLGLNEDRYLITNESEPDFSGTSNLTLIDSGIAPLCSFYAGGGAPLGFTSVDNFAIRYHGFFNTQLNGPSPSSITFKVIGFGFIKIIIDGNYVFGSSNSFQALNSLKYLQNSYTPSQSNRWVSFEVQYFSRKGEAGFGLIWKDDIHETFIPVSAGVTSKSDSYLSSTIITDVLSINSINSKGSIGAFSFDVPLVESSDTHGGYYYDRTTEKYKSVEDTDLYLKKYDLVEINLGYYEKSDGEFTSTKKLIKSAIGHITSFNIERNPNGDDVLTVNCNGFDNFLKTTLNYNYPDKLDYWLSNFAGIEFSRNTPDGIDFPSTYDNWPLDDAFKSLLNRGFIDPTLSLKKRTFLNVSGTAISGSFLIEESVPEVILERARNYGNPNVSLIPTDRGEEGNIDPQIPDDEYILKSNFGDTIFDYVTKMVEPYGWDWGSNSYYDGAFYLRTRNNPSDIIGTKNITFTDVATSASNVVEDSFTDADDTLLPDHTPDIDVEGGGWNSDSGTAKILSNRCRITDNGPGNIFNNGGHWIDSGISDATIVVKFRQVSSGILQGGIIFRHIDNNNYLYIEHRGSSTDVFRIGKVEGGSNTELDSASFSATDDDEYCTITLIFDGDDITATIVDSLDGDNTATVSTTTTKFLTETEHGIWPGAVNAVTEYNDFSIQSSDDSIPNWNQQTDLDAISGTFQVTSGTGDYGQYTFEAQRIDAVLALANVKAGTQALTASGVSTTQVDIMDEVGDGFAVGNTLIFELNTGNEAGYITNISANRITLDSAFPLSTTPPSGTLIRSAVAEYQIVRGNSFDTSTFPVVASGLLPSYHSVGFDDIVFPLNLSSEGINTSSDLFISGTRRYFYHGIDTETGQNPTKFKLATGLTRDEHTVRITRLTDADAGEGTEIRLNALFLYDQDKNFPVRTYYTGDTLASGTVIDLKIDSPTDDQRNDVITVGRRVGAEVPGGNEQSVPANPNNPINRHFVSRAIDVNSIKNPNSINFTGRPLQTILIDPSIASQDRVDHWSVEFLNRFRRIHSNPSFQALANPLIEVGDPIYVVDSNKGTTDNTKVLWIDSIDRAIDNKSFIDTYKTTGFPPWASFIPKTIVDIDADFDGEPFSNITITPETSPTGYLYDPYKSDEVGEVIQIKFDQNITGFVKATVFSYNGIKIAELLNPADSDESKRGWKFDTAGSNKIVTWDGVDQFGIYNQDRLEPTEETENTDGFFVAEDSKLFTPTNQENYGRFYVVLQVQNNDGEPLSTSTKFLDNETGFINTKRGEQISISVNRDNVITASNLSTDYLVKGEDTFYLNENKNELLVASNKGKTLVKIPVTVDNDKVRLAMLRVSLSVLTVGSILKVDGKTDDEFILERSYDLYDPGVFIDYAQTDSVIHFNPEQSGFRFGDWDTTFHPENGIKLKLREEDDTDEGVAAFMTHLFLFKFIAVDKSGRSSTTTMKLRWLTTSTFDHTDPKSNSSKVGEFVFNGSHPDRETRVSKLTNGDGETYYRIEDLITETNRLPVFVNGLKQKTILDKTFSSFSSSFRSDVVGIVAYYNFFINPGSVFVEEFKEFEG